MSTQSSAPKDGREKVHILVLETDSPHPETEQRKGSFGQIVDQLFNKAGNAHSPPLAVETSMHYVVDDPKEDHHGHVPSIDEIPPSTRAILITGSMYDAHGNDPWIKSLLALLQQLWKQRPEIRFSGVCFGHQILCRMLGSTVNPHPGEKWELAHTEMSLTPLGQKLFRTKESKLHLHQMHQDYVANVPSAKTTSLLTAEQSVKIWASTEHTEIQGVYLKDRLFTSQGHLGFDREMVKRQIEMRQDAGAIDAENEDHAEEAKETSHLEHDGEVVAGAILRFFHGEDADVE